MSQQEEITAVFKSEHFRFPNVDGDVIVGEAFMNGEINDFVSIKGQADEGELRFDHEYRFFGKWTIYHNKRTGEKKPQFAFVSFVPCQPHGRDAVVAYLADAGEGKGFGRSRAARVWDAFGESAVERCREDIEAVADVLIRARLPISMKQLEQLAAELKQRQATEGCTLDLMTLLKGRGFPKTTAQSVIRKWGNRGATLIRRNPYLLMNFHGCGFKRCDALYIELGLPPERLKRQALCAWHAIATQTEGHTWFPIPVAEQGIKANVAGAKLRIPEALTLAIRGRALAETFTDGIQGPMVPPYLHDSPYRWIAEHKNAEHEFDIAKRIEASIGQSTLWPDAATVVGISDHQREELAKAISGQVGILCGGPGTGKTWVVAKLVAAIIAKHGSDNVLIGAPTGKAAVRVTENLAGQGIAKRARTWHSLLMQLETVKQKYFAGKFLIGDESSMNDVDLFARICRAMPAGCHLLLVGDVGQLPPVGHGAPLRDLIAAGLPCGRLTEIKRNSGGIVEACADIAAGRVWQPADNLSHWHLDSVGQQIEYMFKAIQMAKLDGLDPIWDCQVLVPLNAKSELSRAKLNSILQERLNSNPGVKGQPFRVGDKIVNTKNGYFPTIEADSDEETATNDRGDVYVANGELAEVIEAAESYTVAKLSNPHRLVRIPRGKSQQQEQPLPDGETATGTGCTWDLGYALSVHKSQGSEWPVAIVMVDEYPGARNVCSREWLYTAISRAKKRCVVIGKKSTADAFCRNVAIKKRKTLLRETIHLLHAQRQLSEL